MKQSVHNEIYKELPPYHYTYTTTRIKYHFIIYIYKRQRLIFEYLHLQNRFIVETFNLVYCVKHLCSK